MWFIRMLRSSNAAAVLKNYPLLLGKLEAPSSNLAPAFAISAQLFPLSTWAETQYKVIDDSLSLLLRRFLSTTSHQTLQQGKKHNTEETKNKIAVGISGGVDSAVAALLLKQAGYEVVGVFMRNWDETEETGKTRHCTIEKDYKDASAVCTQLNIPLYEADFIAQYWNEVFTRFLAECSRGLTPNPDLACNRHIKFGALLEFAKRQLGVEMVATGHYARIKKIPSSSSSAFSATYSDENDGVLQAKKVQLLQGIDGTKDQSYFLASIHPEALNSVLFPLGEFEKSTVREIAAKYKLVPAEKRSSAGICFIGRRNFAEFLEQYLPIVPGRFIDVDNGKDVGRCENILSVTIGQRPGIGGASDRTYVAGKDINTGIVYIAKGRNHPALATKSAMLRTPHWLSREHFDRLKCDKELQCEYKARYGQKSAKCTLKLVHSEEITAEKGFKKSRFCGLQAEDSKINDGYVVVHFDKPAGAITPQQEFVMYDGDVCIGSAAIAMPGQTLHEEREGGENHNF